MDMYSMALMELVFALLRFRAHDDGTPKPFVKDEIELRRNAENRDDFIVGWLVGCSCLSSWLIVLVVFETRIGTA